MTATAPITNIAAYQFAPLTELKPLRAELLEFCKNHELRGTILLSPEGVNLFIAGTDEAVQSLLTKLRTMPGLEQLEAKFSYSEEQPFRRMLVRLKREIISFGVPGIEPGKRTSPKLKPAELKQWLDEGRPVTLLDTRNDYEVKLGSFKGAHILPISHFRQFPDAVRALPEELKQAPIVMFCTGGIRCEKAGPFMEREGFSHIHQLEGGILRYFEEVGSAHYEGECFVFDQRTGVDPALAETQSTTCHACQEPLSAEDQADPRYVPQLSCPYCFKTSAEQAAAALEARRQRLREVAHPLPGSLPYSPQRPLHVPEACAGLTVLDTLDRLFEQVGREEWLRIIEGGRVVTRAEQRVLGAYDVLQAGDQIVHLLPPRTEPSVSGDLRLIHEDEALLVVEKPASLPVFPEGEFGKNTLLHLLHLAYAPEKPRVLSQLTIQSTGLVLAARTQRYAKTLLAGQIEMRCLLQEDGKEVLIRGLDATQLQPHALHVQQLSFIHPLTQQRVSFTALR